MGKKTDYTPDLATLMRESTKEALEAKLNKALDNPRLDAALARVRPKLRPGEDPLFYDVDRLSSPSLTGVTPVDAVAGPRPSTGRGDEGRLGTETEHTEGDETAAPESPWATSGAAEPDLDRDALPSAHVPPAAPPTSVPIPRQPGRPLPPWLAGAFSRWGLVSLVLCLLIPVTIAVVLSRQTRPKESEGAAPTVAAATAPSAPTTRPPAAPPTSPSAAPTATLAEPPAVDGGAAIHVQPVPSSAPTHHPAVPAVPIRAPQPTPTNDPASPPSPPAPAAPAPAPPPTVTPSTPPAAPTVKTPTDIY